MRVRNRKKRGPRADEPIQGHLRKEIEGDVFELWIGISRLMARLNGPHRRYAVDGPEAANGKQSAI
jgi:hypothetical protein